MLFDAFVVFGCFSDLLYFRVCFKMLVILCFGCCLRLGELFDGLGCWLV